MADNSEPQEPASPKKDDLGDILRRVDSLPILDPRSPDEIVGYDEDGLPTQVTTGRMPICHLNCCSFRQ